MTKIELTETDIEFLHVLLGDRNSTRARALLAKLPARKLEPVKCRHCTYTTTNMIGLIAHLINTERYEDDTYGEDTAQSNAWKWFNEAGWNPPKFP